MECGCKTNQADIYITQKSIQMIKQLYFRLLLIITLIAFGASNTSHAQTLPTDFYDEMVSDDFDIIAGFTFDETGQMYAWDMNGVVWVLDTNGIKQPEPLIDISEEVARWRDHGLLGFALDPNFASNGYYYLWYIVDRHHLMYYGTPQYHPDSSWSYASTIGRITRYTADAATGFKTTIPDSRYILLGETKETGVPVIGFYHGGGTLLFGEDKTLMLSVGDCATGSGVDTGGVAVETYALQALEDGIITPDQDIGLYRCQYLGSLNGKILRIDPATGDGVSSNPFYDPANPRSAQSRTWALGFRNPFRMTLVEGTGSHSPADGRPGTLVVGDVGFQTFEEINIVDEPGLNFGWPYYEGHYKTYMDLHPAPFNRLAPNPLYGTGDCNQPYFTFKDLLAPPHKNTIKAKNPCNSNVNIPNSMHLFKLEPPHVVYLNEFYENEPDVMINYYNNNGDGQVISVDDPNSWIVSEKFDGQCSIGGVFYKGDNFPDEYQGVYFHGDFRGWIRAFHFDDENNVYKIDPFMDGSDDMSTMAVSPKDGALYYVGHLREIHKISYGGNPRPVAIANADTYYGASPLEVNFDADLSFDPQGEQLTYQWNFGDGNISTEVSPTHTFNAPDNTPTPFEVKLTVTDSIGQVAEAVIVISVNNTPPSVEITSFRDGDLYPGHKSTTLPLTADVSDAESNTEHLTYSWQTFLHHNTHYHPEPKDARPATHTLISPVGCADDVFYFRVRLEVTDEHGLTTMKEQYIYPYCGDDFVEFIDLNAIEKERAILLEWAAAFEDSILHYEVERSRDIWNFEKIGQVNAATDQSGTNTYSFLDDGASHKLHYYRIKAYRANGALAYSRNITAKLSNGVVDVFPNPSSGIVDLYFSDDYEEVVFTIQNSQGKEMKQYSFNNVSKNQVEQLNLDLSSGTYFYTTKAAATTENGKLIILNGN